MVLNIISDPIMLRKIPSGTSRSLMCGKKFTEDSRPLAKLLAFPFKNKLIVFPTQTMIRTKWLSGDLFLSNPGACRTQQFLLPILNE